MKAITMTKKRQEKVELLGGVIWACMDISWMMGIHFICFAFILPMILSMGSLALFVKSNNLKIFNASWFSWTLMNVFWMCSEIMPMPSLLLYAKIFGIAGFIFMAISFRNAPGRQKLIHHMIMVRQKINNFFA